MDSNPFPSEAGRARVHPRRRHRLSAANGAPAVTQSRELVFSAPLESSEVRRRFADIYEQADRIAQHSR